MLDTKYYDGMRWTELPMVLDRGQPGNSGNTRRAGAPVAAAGRDTRPAEATFKKTKENGVLTSKQSVSEKRETQPQARGGGV